MYFHAHFSFPIPSFPRSTELPEGTCPMVIREIPGPASPQSPSHHGLLPVAEIGVGITGFGAFFILLGALLYFDSVLLAFGNVSAPALRTVQPP